MKSAVFFDIDGTLATYQREISPAVKSYIKNLKASGTAVFICSGRGVSDLPKSITDMEFDGYICSTGAYIFSKGKQIYNCLIPPAVLKGYFAFLKEQKASSYFDTKDFLCRVEFGIPLLSEYPKISDAKTLSALPINSMSYRTPSPEVSEALISYMEQYCRVIPYTPSFGDIIPLGCSKSKGIHILLKHLGLSSCRTLAIGDSENDIDMIQAVDIGIAMKNSPKELLDAADFVTGTLEEDGVVTALQKYL